MKKRACSLLSILFCFIFMYLFMLNLNGSDVVPSTITIGDVLF